MASWRHEKRGIEGVRDLDTHLQGLNTFLGSDIEWSAVLASPRGRLKLIAEVEHLVDSGSPVVQHVEGAETEESLKSMLSQLGAPETCAVFSRDPRLCGREMPLSKAIHISVGGCRNVLVSCLPGELAFYESEEKGKRYLLRVPQP